MACQADNRCGTVNWLRMTFSDEGSQHGVLDAESAFWSPEPPINQWTMDLNPVCSRSATLSEAKLVW
jgi:hypothetical protein